MENTPVLFPEPPLTASQAADEIGCHRATVSKYVIEGFMHSYATLPDGTRLFTRDEVQRIKHTRRPQKPRSKAS